MGQEEVKDQPSPTTANAPQTSVEVQPEGVVTDEVAAESEVQVLRRELAEKEALAQASHERFLRERAELENFKRRMLREKAEALRFAAEPLVRDLLPVVDNLERALEHADRNDQPVVDGVRMVLSSLLDVLERHGVRRIEAEGQPFDPSRHEAMAQVESDEHTPNQVVKQHHRGYLLHDRLLRPALVTVSARKTGVRVESDPNSD
jgi:molecular chaperone GrpE